MTDESCEAGDSPKYHRPFPHLMGDDELCAKFKCKPITLWRMRKRTELPPPIRIAGHLYTDETLIKKYLDRRQKA